jgi:hypothetical protein
MSEKITPPIVEDDKLLATPEGLKVLQAWEALKLLEEGKSVLCCLHGWKLVRLSPPVKENQFRTLQIFQPEFPDHLAWQPSSMDITGFLSHPWRIQLLDHIYY